MIDLSADPLDLSDLSKINYSLYSLQMNPFPAIGIPEEAPSTTADRREILEEFRRSLSRTLFDNKKTIMVVTGDFGAGKSHILKYFRFKVNVQLLQDEKVLAIYVKTVGRNFRDLYLNFVDGISRDFFSELASSIVKKQMEDLGDAKLRKFVFDKELDKIEDLAKVNVDSYLRGSRSLDFFKSIRAKYSGISNSNAIYAILNLAHPVYSSAAWRWLLGESISKEEMFQILVDGFVGDVKESQSTLIGIIEFLLNAKLNAVTILIDELEKLTLIPRNLREVYMDDIRHFIDDMPAKVFVILAITPTAYNDINQFETALTRRLAGTEQELRFFTPDDTKELIARYLKLGRKTQYVPSNFKETSAEFFPFTFGAIERIDSRSKGLISKIITLCREGIELGIVQRKRLIDEEIIDSVKL